MTKFKKGDKVKRIDNDCAWVYVGGEYIVDECYGEDTISLVGLQGMYSPCYFTLKEPALTFPRKMNVRDYTNGCWKIIEVHAIVETLGYPYITYNGDAYRYGKEIEVPKVTEFTLQEIADKMGVSVETIRIKD